MGIMATCPATGQKFDTGADLDDAKMAVEFEAWCDACARMHTGRIRNGVATLGPLTVEREERPPAAEAAPARRRPTKKKAPASRTRRKRQPPPKRAGKPARTSRPKTRR